MTHRALARARDADGAPTASVFVNDVSRAPGYARLAAHHTANFGAVDVLVDGAVAFPGVSNGQQGVAPLRPRSYEVAIAGSVGSLPTEPSLSWSGGP